MDANTNGDIAQDVNAGVEGGAEIRVVEGGAEMRVVEADANPNPNPNPTLSLP